LTQKTKKKKTSFGDWLREERTSKGIGVRELASLAEGECSASYISYLERNVYAGKEGNPTRPSESIVAALAYGLDVPLNEARFAAGYAPLTAGISEDAIVRAFPSLFAGYEVLSEKGKRLAEKQIDNLIRGLMEMEGVSFGAGAAKSAKQDEEVKPGLETDQFTIDLSSPEPASEEDDEEFQFMSDEELRSSGLEIVIEESESDPH
jgi:transcriptional regulator with XRE-family HTH domain